MVVFRMSSIDGIINEAYQADSSYRSAVEMTFAEVKVTARRG